MKQMMIGNAHIDPVWFWRWQEGLQEVKATFRSALDRMNETPGFVFTCACASYYQWVEENAPDLFAEIRERIQEGRWVIAGGMWIQPDMNISGGESLARQLLYSQRYFKERFGLTASFGYNVDSFGHNAMMPQLYRKAGMDAYVWMRPSAAENPSIPEGSMIWESPDGSRILAHRIHGEYTCPREVYAKIEKLFEFSGRVGQPVMCFYGVGNHGGGPTIANIKEIERYQREGKQGQDVVFASPRNFFDLLKAEDVNLPIWKTELQHHASGCYSTHSASKLKHRKAENSLLRMEKLGVLSERLTGHRTRDTFVRQAWDNLMFNEFHDAMGGCAAEDVLNDVVVQLDEAISIAEREENAALQRISWQVDTIKGLPDPRRYKCEDYALWGLPSQGTPVVVFNPHAFDAVAEVQIRRPIRTVCDDAGARIPSQVIRAGRMDGKNKFDAVFRAQVPALGYRLFWVSLQESGELPDTGLSVSARHLENQYLRAEFHPRNGTLCALICKKTGMNALAGCVNVNLMDIEHCDTWAHNVFCFDKQVGSFGAGKIRVLEEGPVRAVVSVLQRYGQSEIEQIYTLWYDSDQLDVQVRLNLREHHRMIKLCFPTPFKRGADISEIPYGVLKRRPNGEEEVCQRWCAMEGEQGGLAVMNNGKYSYSAENGELRMTIANTSIFADHFGQKQRDHFCRFMDQGEQIFALSLVPYNGSWNQAGLEKRSTLLNEPLPFVVETYHEGKLPAQYCGIHISDECIRMGALKRAENGMGYVIRLIETGGRAVKAEIDLMLLDRKLTLDFSAFEIKTLFVPDTPCEPCREMLITEWE